MNGLKIALASSSLLAMVFGGANLVNAKTVSHNTAISPSTTISGGGGSSYTSGLSSTSGGGNPWNCIGQTNLPHNSGHIGGNVTVGGTTSCTIFGGQTISVQEDLYYVDGNGNLQWMAENSYGPTMNSSMSVTTNAGTLGLSGTWEYVGIGHHYAYGPDGSDYSAVTENTNVVSD